MGNVCTQRLHEFWSSWAAAICVETISHRSAGGPETTGGGGGWRVEPSGWDGETLILSAPRPGLGQLEWRENRGENRVWAGAASKLQNGGADEAAR